MDAAPSRSLFRYFIPADAFVRILVHGPHSGALRVRPGLNRVAYRRLVIESCCPDYAGDLSGRLAEQCPHDPLAAEDLLYQLCVEVNPQLDIHSVSLAPVGDAELTEEVGDVPGGGAAADEEPLGNLRVGQALAEQPQDLPLPPREIGARR